ncbi:MAG: hypothetical protein K6L75_04925 [Cellvibrionaceae bacterium]
MNITDIKFIYIIKQVASISLLTFLVSSCSTRTAKIDKALNTKEYCDRYFVYRMCAKDFDGDGIVDGMYFEDSNDIFMYRETEKKLVENYHPFHICAQVMDQKLTDASSALLGINEDTSRLKRSELKSSIFVNYMRYASAINQCNKKYGNDNFDMTEEDDFGLSEDDEYNDEY